MTDQRTKKITDRCSSIRGICTKQSDLNLNSTFPLNIADGYTDEHLKEVKII